MLSELQGLADLENVVGASCGRRYLHGTAQQPRHAALRYCALHLAAAECRNQVAELAAPEHGVLHPDFPAFLEFLVLHVAMAAMAATNKALAASQEFAPVFAAASMVKRLAAPLEFLVLLSFQVLLGPVVPAIHARCSPLVLKRLLLLLRRLRMESGEELGRKTDTAVADAWSHVRLQEFADKAAVEKATHIRKRLGDQDLHVSCTYPTLVLV